MVLLCLTFAFFSCGDDADSSANEPGEYQSKLINVEVEATAESFAGDSFSWQQSDNITLFYTRSGSIYPATFTYNASNLFGGQLWSWQEQKSLYAIYRRGEDTSSLSFDSGSVTLSSDMLFEGNLSLETVPLSAREVGIMVAAVDDATANSEADYSIPTFEFKQVASLLQLKFSDGLEDAEVVKLELSPKSSQNANFISSAEVSVTSSGVVVGSVDRVVSIERDVEATESISGKYLALPLFPVNISEDLTLTLTANGVDDKEGWRWSYAYDILGGVSFVRAETEAIDELSWSAHFTQTTLASVTSASDLAVLADSGAVPEGDTWVIKTDQTASTQEVEEALANLSAILSLETVAEASVAIELPGVTELPADTFSGSGENSNSALASVSLSDVTTVGEAAFAANTSVKEVVLGSTSDDGDEVEVTLAEGVFTDCTAMTLCVINTTALPKATFKGCAALNTISLSKVTTIGESGCEGCSSLFTDTQSTTTTTKSGASIELVFTTIESISERAFFGCTQFDVIRLNESSDVVVNYIADDAFSYEVGGEILSYTPNINLYLGRDEGVRRYLTQHPQGRRYDTLLQKHLGRRHRRWHHSNSR